MIRQFVDEEHRKDIIAPLPIVPKAGTRKGQHENSGDDTDSTDSIQPARKA